MLNFTIPKNVSKIPYSVIVFPYRDRIEYGKRIYRERLSRIFVNLSSQRLQDKKIAQEMCLQNILSDEEKKWNNDLRLVGRIIGNNDGISNINLFTSLWKN